MARERDLPSPAPCPPHCGGTPHSRSAAGRDSHVDRGGGLQPHSNECAYGRKDPAHSIVGALVTTRGGHAGYAWKRNCPRILTNSPTGERRGPFHRRRVGDNAWGSCGVCVEAGLPPHSNECACGRKDPSHSIAGMNPGSFPIRALGGDLGQQPQELRGHRHIVFRTSHHGKVRPIVHGQVLVVSFDANHHRAGNLGRGREKFVRHVTPNLIVSDPFDVAGRERIAAQNPVDLSPGNRVIRRFLQDRGGAAQEQRRSQDVGIRALAIQARAGKQR